MYETIRSDLSTKMRDLLMWLDSLTENQKICKGLFFVYLYGIWEATVMAVLQQTIMAVNQANISIQDGIYDIYTLAFSDEYNSLYSAGDKTKWQKRMKIAEKLKRNDTLMINTSAIPTDGKNIQIQQLQSIAQSFGMTKSVLPRPEIQGHLHTVVQNRNYIAHGDYTPEEIGGRFSKSDLERIYNEMNTLAMYVIDCYDEYIQNRSYLKTT